MLLTYATARPTLAGTPANDARAGWAGSPSDRLPYLHLNTRRRHGTRSFLCWICLQHSRVLSSRTARLSACWRLFLPFSLAGIDTRRAVYARRLRTRLLLLMRLRYAPSYTAATHSTLRTQLPGGRTRETRALRPLTNTRRLPPPCRFLSMRTCCYLPKRLTCWTAAMPSSNAQCRLLLAHNRRRVAGDTQNFGAVPHHITCRHSLPAWLTLWAGAPIFAYLNRRYLPHQCLPTRSRNLCRRGRRRVTHADIAVASPRCT